LYVSPVLVSMLADEDVTAVSSSLKHVVAAPTLFPRPTNTAQLQDAVARANSGGLREPSKGGKTNKILFDRVMYVFMDFDVNGDGTLDRNELGGMLQRLDAESWSDDRVDALMLAIDTGKDGRIQFEEFIRWVFGGKPDEQSAFREYFNLNSIATEGAVTIEVKNADDNDVVVFGPTEALGSMTVAWLRRRIRAHSGQYAAMLFHHGEVTVQNALRDAFVLGAYCADAEERLDLMMISDAFQLLTERCIEDLKSLKACTKYHDVPCIRMGTGNRRAIGDDGNEILLTARGQIFAKAYSCLGYVDQAKKLNRNWKFEIAEGSFTILDADLCHIEITWRKWAVRRGTDCGKDAADAADSAADLLEDWESQEIADDNRPSHLVPNAIRDYVGINQIARSWLQDRKQRYEDVQNDPMAGFAMPGITDLVLYSLEMDESVVDYWRHGKKKAGPFQQEEEPQTELQQNMFSNQSDF